ncbi:MAG: response regulator [Burkholderiales bacterium]|nr:response regulator [Anaerolineae bacterium]
MEETLSMPLMLVVDDEPANRSLLKRLFQQQFNVKAVGDGQTALDMLAQAPFDMVLLDIMMPEMDGLEVLEIMRGRPSTCETPVILISALSGADDVVQGLKLGANDYIVKPIDTDVTYARVQTQLMLKRLQDERKEIIADLQAANELKDQFLRIASHDLKGPLGNIRLAQHLLRKIVADNEKGNSLLDMIETTVEKMNALIMEFLDTSAMQSGKVDMRMSDAPLDRMIEDVVEQQQLTAIKKDILLDLQRSDLTILADPERFKQALTNLVSNAIKYSPSNSVVTIWTEISDQCARIHVSDQGQGIPVEERDRLFTMFGKLTPRPTAGESSTGLGLWIVKHLVTLQNGQVGVECPSEGGSIFWIELPISS